MVVVPNAVMVVGTKIIEAVLYADQFWLTVDIPTAVADIQ
jgi:hypothetical protein